MTTYGHPRGHAAVWPRVIDRSPGAGRSYLADMAAKGNWPRVMEYFDPDNHQNNVKQWRGGDKSWTTVLHEAARLDAPIEIVSVFLDRGALRLQTDADGRAP